MTDDASDLTAAAAGDDQALARLYDRHAGVVLSLCRRKSLSETEAEDATQQTFIRAHERLRQVADRPERFRPWLYAIAKRVCAERRRAARRRRRHEKHAVIRRTDHRPPVMSALDSAVQAEAAAIQAKQLDRLGAALDTLPDRERLAIHLYYLDADPIAAAASALGLSRGGFYKLLARARKHLATEMGDIRST